ncbi:MAG: tetratricopeptide repeat protein, partial [Spirochaetia bacterium]|nr:tetratricopeptide repeat protein [Spirochaetia bacterium]
MDDTLFRNYRISHEARVPFEEGYRLHLDRRFAEACECYKRSVEICPSAEAHTFMGWALSCQGLYELAIEECRKAIAIDPDFGNPYNDIGAYLIELGRLDEAEEWLEKAKHANRYDNPEFPCCNL